MKAIDPKNLLERLELIELKTKNCHDGLFDEKLIYIYYCTKELRTAQFVLFKSCFRSKHLLCAKS